MESNTGALRNSADAAAYIRDKYAQPCSVNLLDKAAVAGTGPKFRKVSGRFRIYAEADLNEWALSRLGPLVRSTSEADSQLEPKRLEALHAHHRKGKSSASDAEAA
jgi:hypothetical protein